jgi:hypothetical protein
MPLRSLAFGPRVKKLAHRRAPFAMPKIDIPGPYRFHFFSDEGNEPPHVHIKREKAICKFWLDPLSLAENHGFAAHELTKIEKLIVEHRTQIEAAWHEHFKSLR